MKYICGQIRYYKRVLADKIWSWNRNRPLPILLTFLVLDISFEYNDRLPKSGKTLSRFQEMLNQIRNQLQIEFFVFQT